MPFWSYQGKGMGVYGLGLQRQEGNSHADEKANKCLPGTSLTMGHWEDFEQINGPCQVSVCLLHSRLYFIILCDDSSLPGTGPLNSI